MLGYYSAFGGRVQSELPLPELPRADVGPADWTLREARHGMPKPNGDLLGVANKGACRITLWRSETGFRLRHTCVGEYDISADGSHITCWRNGDSSNEAIQNDLTGRLIPLAFHARGALCLHASGVDVGGSGAVAFVGEPRIGKSTLAYAMVQRGARLSSDDVVILETQPNVVMRSGVPRLRLCSDAAACLVATDTPRKSPFDRKHVIELQRPDALAALFAPLRAIYLLAPTRVRRTDPAARRTQLLAQPASLLLVRHARLGRVLSKDAAADVLIRAAAVARQVPVYVLHLAHDLARINEVAAAVMAWHTEPVAATGTHG